MSDTAETPTLPTPDEWLDATLKLSFMVDDRSLCRYYRGVGSCSFGCHEEPDCQTGHPGEEGWPLEALAPSVRRLLEQAHDALYDAHLQVRDKWITELILKAPPVPTEPQEPA